MIRNLVFDMGGVLIRYDPEHFIRREGFAGADAEMLLKAVFHSKEWPMLDKGDLDEPEAEKIMLPRLPERLRDAGRKLLYRWNDPVEPIAGMADLIRDMKARGYAIYLLSNASRRQKDYWPDIPGHEYFDGRLVSADVRLVKPMPEIFRLAQEMFGIAPDESLFTDDVPANVAGAENAGFRGYLFDGNADALRRFIVNGGETVS